MRERPLGRTGTDVSALCLGCMAFGTRLDEATSFGLADRYVAAGGRFVDTANNYAFWTDGGVGGESEALLGRWLTTRRNRPEIFLATKVGANPTEPGAGLERAEGLSAPTIARAVDESLRRLGTDHVDLLYAHIDDRSTPLEETLAAFDRLVRAGKVRHVGCSNAAAWRVERARGIARANGWAAYCGVQQRHSYLRPKPGADLGVQVAADDGLLDYCRANDDVTLLAYSPLLAGAYARPGAPLPEGYAGPDADARLAALARVAAEVGATPNQVVLAWLTRGSPSVVPLIAASTPERLQENIDALEVVLDRRQLDELSAAGA